LASALISAAEAASVLEGIESRAKIAIRIRDSARSVFIGENE
jgi:hypothetical protein